LARIVRGGALAALIVCTLASLDHFGLLASKSAQIVSILAAFIGYGIFMIWNAMTFKMFCPRCGWNIYFKNKYFPAHMFISIPSSCPNCGLDLECAYNPKP